MTNLSKDCPDQLTTASHIFLAIASACFAWILFCIPAMKLMNSKWSLWLIMFTLLVYCIIIPAVMISNESIFTNLSGEKEFMLAKFISVIGGIFIISGCLLYNYSGVKLATKLKDGCSWIAKKIPRFEQTLNNIGASLEKISFEKAMTFLISVLMIVNIGEAGYVSFNAVKENKPEVDNITEFQPMNLSLGIMSVILILVLLINIFKSENLMNASYKDGFLKLSSNFGWLFILAYTFWNLAFRVQLVENTSVLLFFTVSLLLPIVTHFLKIGDWMQIRAYTLLFLMIINMGLAYGEGSLFPSYNQTGYEKHKDLDDVLTKPLRTKELKIFLVVISVVLTLLALFKSTGGINYAMSKSSTIANYSKILQEL